MSFLGISRESLQQALLNRMGELANLRKASKQYREQLSLARSRMAEIDHEVKEIHALLEKIITVPTPQTAEVQEPLVINRARKRA